MIHKDIYTGHRPVAIGVDHPGLRLEEPLTAEQQSALFEDILIKRGDEGVNQAIQ
ncbi:hypothetical protein KJ966_07560 [bacterium]|nr:hypothetical protein [bacterium]